MRVSDTVVELVGAWDSKSRSRKRVVVPAGLEPADPYGIRTRVAAVKGQNPVAQLPGQLTVKQLLLISFS